MNNKKNSSSLAAVTSAAAGSRQPTVNVVSFDLAGEGMARVVCSVTHAGNSRDDHSAVASAMRKKFLGKMEAVAGSFVSLSSGQFQEQIAGVISVVREAMPATKENLKGFRSVSANMFMDEEEKMWVVRKSSAGDLVVKTTGIDDDMSLLKILNQACAGSSSLSSVSDFRQMVAHASAVSDHVTGGDFVSYVNQNNEIACGFVVATAHDVDTPDVTQAIILPVDGDQEEVVNVKAITEVHPTDSFPEVETTQQEGVDVAVAAARGTTSLQTILDYYKRIYARSPKFYAMFASRLKAHAFC